MNIDKRLFKLEKITISPIDNRAPLLVRFIDTDTDTGKIIGLSGILYSFGDHTSVQRFNAQELKEYEQSKAMT